MKKKAQSEYEVGNFFYFNTNIAGTIAEFFSSDLKQYGDAIRALDGDIRKIAVGDASGFSSSETFERILKNATSAIKDKDYVLASTYISNFYYRLGEITSKGAEFSSDIENSQYVKQFAENLYRNKSKNYSEKQKQEIQNLLQRMGAKEARLFRQQLIKTAGVMDSLLDSFAGSMVINFFFGSSVNELCRVDPKFKQFAQNTELELRKAKSIEKSTRDKFKAMKLYLSKRNYASYLNSFAGITRNANNALASFKKFEETTLKPVLSVLPSSEVYTESVKKELIEKQVAQKEIDSVVPSELNERSIGEAAYSNSLEDKLNGMLMLLNSRSQDNLAGIQDQIKALTDSVAALAIQASEKKVSSPKLKAAVLSLKKLESSDNAELSDIAATSYEKIEQSLDTDSSIADAAIDTAMVAGPEIVPASPVDNDSTAPIVVDTATVPVTVEEPVKRGRGRPRKTPKNPEAAAITEAAVKTATEVITESAPLITEHKPTESPEIPVVAAFKKKMNEGTKSEKDLMDLFEEHGVLVSSDNLSDVDLEDLNSSFISFNEKMISKIKSLLESMKFKKENQTLESVKNLEKYITRSFNKELSSINYLLATSQLPSEVESELMNLGSYENDKFIFHSNIFQYQSSKEKSKTNENINNLLAEDTSSRLNGLFSNIGRSLLDKEGIESIVKKIKTLFIYITDGNRIFVDKIYNGETAELNKDKKQELLTNLYTKFLFLKNEIENYPDNEYKSNLISAISSIQAIIQDEVELSNAPSEVVHEDIVNPVESLPEQPSTEPEMQVESENNDELIQFILKNTSKINKMTSKQLDVLKSSLSKKTSKQLEEIKMFLVSQLADMKSEKPTKQELKVDEIDTESMEDEVEPHTYTDEIKDEDARKDSAYASIKSIKKMLLKISKNKANRKIAKTYRNNGYLLEKYKKYNV